MLEHPTAESGCSYSRGEYPTPSATPYGSSQNEGQVPHKRPSNGTRSLETWAAKLWPTATAGDAKASGSRNSPNSKANGGLSLTDAATTGNSTGRGAKLWPTAGANDHKGTAKEGQRRRQLDEAAEQKFRPGPPAPTETGAESPNTSSPLWCSPQGRDWKGTVQDPEKFAERIRRGRQLNLTEQATQETSGPNKRLNPTFVEWLMGFPIWWTWPSFTEPTVSGHWGTPLSPPRPSSLFANSSGG